MKSGFMLIELIVATMIATLVAGVLFAALTLGNRFQVAIDTEIDMSERIGIIANQLEKDLMGAFIPTQAEQKGGKSVGSVDESADENKSADTKDAGKTTQPAQQGSEKKEPKPIEKIFYSTNKNGMLDTLTFVTNNPLTVFVGKDVGVVKSKVARVQYTLRPEGEKKDSYALFRQEGSELDLNEYKNVRAYEVIGGIKKCAIKFIARIEKKQEQKGEQQDKEKEKKVEYEYKELVEWVSEQKKDESKADKDEKKNKDAPEFPRIPYRVELSMTLWDKNNKTDKDITLGYEIPIDFSKPKKENKQRPEAAQKNGAPQRPDAANKQTQPSPQKMAHATQVTQQETVVVETLTNTLGNLTKLLKQM